MADFAVTAVLYGLRLVTLSDFCLMVTVGCLFCVDCCYFVCLGLFLVLYYYY